MKTPVNSLIICWVSLSMPMDSVAAFEKGTTLLCKPRLAMTTDKLTELGKIILKEH